jgi:hypothetical protein
MTRLISLLAEKVNCSVLNVHRILANDPSNYRTFHIPKANGGKRLICEPSPALKQLQKLLTAEITPVVPIHPAAFAYRRSLSIKENAQRHAASQALRRYDFADFFSSLSAHDWHAHCHRTRLFDEDMEDIAVSTRIFFNDTIERGNWRLAMGAPSSPFVSNALLYPFDEEVTDQVSMHGITYTRYADDLTFSASDAGVLGRVDIALERALAVCQYDQLTLNHYKTAVAQKPGMGAITGVYVENDGRLSAGEDRKQCVVAGIDDVIAGKLTPREIASVKGKLAFVLQIEPEFRAALDQRFGAGVVEAIIRFNTRASNGIFQYAAVWYRQPFRG